MEFLEVKKNEIKELADLASEIWHEYWPCILTEAQINYMVEKFQSEKAIIEQILHQNYSYYLFTTFSGWPSMYAARLETAMSIKR